jgi:hypothetical protein
LKRGSASAWLKSLPVWYDRLTQRHTAIVLLLTAVLVGFFAYHARNFRLDASADSLVLEDDPALKTYRTIRARYGSDDYLILTYTPAGVLFEQATLDDLRALRERLAGIREVASVVSILDVPLVRSPPVSLAQLAERVPTLEDPATDTALARRELLNSPLYSNRLISPDGTTTALQINIRKNEAYHELLQRRNELRDRKRRGALTAGERKELAVVTQRFREANSEQQVRLHALIGSVRAVMDTYAGAAELHLAGIPLIVADSIGFIRHDLVAFGAGVFVFLVVILALAFRKPRWVILPLLTCLATGIIMLGLLGLAGWPVTVVSANFPALLLIITLSLTIHLMVRYRELHERNPQAGQDWLVRETVHSKALPCLYTALTTMVAFGSLPVSDIPPVADFGWMMAIGIAVAFVMTFSLFTCALLTLKPGKPVPRRDTVRRITRFFARTAERHGTQTLMVFAVLCVAGMAGLARLSVENRFIDYFKSSTEIHQGMELIDRKLGGTTPLDVILDAPSDFRPYGQGVADDPFTQQFGPDDASGGITSTSYWFNTLRFEKVAAIHDFLDGLPETGKVLSIATTIRMLTRLNDQEDIDNFFLSIVYNKLPDKVREALFDPYLSDDGQQLRIAVRVFETDPTLDRDGLLDSIRRGLTTELGLDERQVQLSGMLVLYNNFLHSLFRSQLLTAGVVFLAILAMFALLFRNLRMAAVAIIPNIFAAVAVLGLMGWLGIPLDLMTITIAAISIGIAVDDTIHYVHRYMHEFRQDGDYWAAVKRSHASIGRALYYTTLTITLGFSILALSSFVPTIYFGLFTGLAMLSALIADLTLLPLLIARLRPLGAAAQRTSP